MWTITQHGFTSVVAYDARKDMNKKSAHRKIAPNPGTHLLVRARVEEDLEVLRSVVPNLVIETDRNADYSYRCVVSRDLFKKYMASEIDQIGYGAHFKEQFQKSAHHGGRRYSGLVKMWTIMAEWQRYTPYTGFDRWAPQNKAQGKPKSKTPFSSSNTSVPSLYDDIAETSEAWAEYDFAEGSGALRDEQVIVIEDVKDIIVTEGYEGLTLTHWANMDKDALAFAEALEGLDEGDLGRPALDELATNIVWKNSTEAEKEIWVDAGGDLPTDTNALEEVDAIAKKLANRG